MTTAIGLAVDASVVTGLALLACHALRSQPAALRHLILAVSLAAAAAVPVFDALLPHWEFAVLSSASARSPSDAVLVSEPAAATLAAVTAPRAPAVPWVPMLLALWGVGFLTVTTRLFGGLARLVSMTRRCRPVRSALWRSHAAALSTQHALLRPAVVLESDERPPLLTWGLVQPRIIVPVDAASWPDARVAAVLAHEFAHIARRDWALQIAAELLRAVHWFNPLMWVACRRLRDESEQACDDLVLGRGIDAADYASHLLAVARSGLATDRGWASAPAIANISTLERRVAVMLNASRNRKPPTRTVRALASLSILVVVTLVTTVTFEERISALPFAPGISHDVALPVPRPPLETPPAATLRPRRPIPRALAAPAPVQAAASLSGTMRDSSGAVLPGVQLTLTESASGAQVSRVSDGNGSFAFRGLAPSQYDLVAVLPGFATMRLMLTLAPGEDVLRSLEMRVGSLQESVVVSCPVGGAAFAQRSQEALMAFGRRAAATPLFAQQVVPIRVGGQIAVPRQVRRVQPVCPGNLPDKGYVVILEGTIGADGRMRDVQTLRPKPGEPPRETAQAAVDAVRQWEFTPTRLNNVPVPVIITVTVTFTR
jgi:TonB family protein